MRSQSNELISKRYLFPLNQPTLDCKITQDFGLEGWQCYYSSFKNDIDIFSSLSLIRTWVRLGASARGFIPWLPLPLAGPAQTRMVPRPPPRAPLGRHAGTAPHQARNSVTIATLICSPSRASNQWVSQAFVRYSPKLPETLGFPFHGPFHFLFDTHDFIRREENQDQGIAGN